MNEAILIGAAFVTATLSGVMGMAGGIVLLSVMTSFFPPAVLIPLHGAVQLASNTTRVGVNFRHLKLKTVGLFAAGGLIGVGIGSQLIVAIPETLYRLALGSFILLLTWMPKLKRAPVVKGKYFFLGTGVSFLTLFVGATGPVMAPFFLRDGYSKEGLVATKAGCQAVQHFYKIVVFGWLGFEFSRYSVLLAGMIAAVMAGTVVGKLILGKIPEKGFQIAVKLLISALSVRLIVMALAG